MKYKHIEASREARLWLGQIIVPLFIGGATLWTIPEVRNNVTDRARQAHHAVTKFISNVTNR